MADGLKAANRGQLCGLAVCRSTPSAVRLRNATASVFDQRHIGRVLRSSRNIAGRRVASSRDREHQTGPMPSFLAG